MKLRNKKTGEIIEYSISLNQWSEDDQEWYLFGNYESIDELKEEWEDYKPAEPLIEDEKIRKALMAVYDAAPHRDNVVYYDGRWTFRGDKFEVMFDDREIKIEGWTEGKAYHIENSAEKQNES